MLPALWFYNKRLDILITHAPAAGLGDLDTRAHSGFHVFRQILDKYKPRFHFHGHVHLNYARHPRVLSYSETTIINGYGHHFVEFR